MNNQILPKVSFETVDKKDKPETLYDFLIKKQGVKKDMISVIDKTITNQRVLM